MSAKRVLVTGSNGAIGRPVCTALLERGHHVRGFDRASNPELEDEVIGDLTERSDTDRAVDGMDVIVHLAAYPDEGDFMSELLPCNIIGLYNILESTAAAGVERMVLASSCQTMNASNRPGFRPRTLADAPGVTNHYGVTKIFLESMGQLYARKHKLAIISARIAWFPRDVSELRRINPRPGAQDYYLSWADTGLFFVRAVEADQPRLGQHVVLFASSRPVNGTGFELATAKRIIGFEPQHGWPEGIEVVPGFTSLEDL